MHIGLRILFLAVMIAGYPSVIGFAVEPSPSALPLMELQLGSGIERGIPIAWGTRQVLLLKSDGSIREFDPSAINKHQVLDEAFQPEKAMQLRGRLQQEFGKRYTVDGGGNFAIVASSKTIQTWTQRFAQLDRSFGNYFRTRGFPLRTAEFPLVGIVFPSQAEFLKYANQNAIKLQSGTVGYYSPKTNRLYLYEMHGSLEAEREALTTVWHEAAHQIGFNRGIHQRLSAPPLWVPEGVASIFEAPGMMASRATMNSADLINVSRWSHWNRLAENPDKMATLFEGMLRDDRLFRSQPLDAYAIAWGVTLYLAERDSHHYMQYLQQLSKLGAGEPYHEEDRVRDFYRYFNTRPQLLIKSADRFLQTL